jgi:hypothetical protein
MKSEREQNTEENLLTGRFNTYIGYGSTVLGTFWTTAFATIGFINYLTNGEIPYPEFFVTNELIGLTGIIAGASLLKKGTQSYELTIDELKKENTILRENQKYFEKH